MARVKVLAHRIGVAAAWIGFGTATLVGAYTAAGAAAHVGSYFEWR